MIHIIKKGTRKEIVCNRCGCLFSYEDEDIKYSGGRPEGYQPTHKSVKCPQCNNEISLGETEKVIPPKT